LKNRMCPTNLQRGLKRRKDDKLFSGAVLGMTFLGLPRLPAPPRSGTGPIGRDTRLRAETYCPKRPHPPKSLFLGEVGEDGHLGVQAGHVVFPIEYF
jgi:hypothetical protein